jgi:Rrf2 family protein
MSVSVVRQDADYALRAMANLAGRYGSGAVSTRILGTEEGISYQFACKILQRLHEKGLVISSMGPKGGYSLSREPAKINMAEIIEAIQGPVVLNKCMPGGSGCDRKACCKVTARLEWLQGYIGRYMQDITLADLLEEGDSDAQEKREIG